MVLRFPILLLTLTTVIMPIDFRKCGLKSYCLVSSECFSLSLNMGSFSLRFPSVGTPLHELNPKSRQHFNEHSCKEALAITPLSVVEWEFEMLGDVELTGIVKCEARQVTEYGDYTAEKVETDPPDYCRFQLKSSDGKAMIARFINAVQINSEQITLGGSVAIMTPSPIQPTPIDVECEDGMVCESPIHHLHMFMHIWKCEQDDLHVLSADTVDWKRMVQIVFARGVENNFRGTGLAPITAPTLMMCRRDKTSLCDETVLKCNGNCENVLTAFQDPPKSIDCAAVGSTLFVGNRPTGRLTCSTKTTQLQHLWESKSGQIHAVEEVECRKDDGLCLVANLQFDCGSSSDAGCPNRKCGPSTVSVVWPVQRGGNHGKFGVGIVDGLRCDKSRFTARPRTNGGNESRRLRVEDGAKVACKSGGSLSSARKSKKGTGNVIPTAVFILTLLILLVPLSVAVYWMCKTAIFLVHHRKIRKRVGKYLLFFIKMSFLKKIPTLNTQKIPTLNMTLNKGVLSLRSNRSMWKDTSRRTTSDKLTLMTGPEPPERDQEPQARIYGKKKMKLGDKISRFFASFGKKKNSDKKEGENGRVHPECVAEVTAPKQPDIEVLRDEPPVVLVTKSELERRKVEQESTPVSSSKKLTSPSATESTKKSEKGNNPASSKPATLKQSS